MIQVPAMRITQRGLGAKGEEVSIYVTALPLGRLRIAAKVDKWTTANPEGYQRPLVDRRLRDVSKYVMQEQGILPTSVLLATRPGEPELAFESKGSLDGFPVWGTLTVPDEAILWVVDGQHRFYGVDRAYEAGVPELEGYPFPVTIMEKVDRYTEMVHFNIINTRQRKMSTDIVDRHLVMRQQREGLQMIASGARGAKEYGQATATRIVDMLNDADGPWHHQIAIPGVPGRDQGLVRQHAMVVSLEPVLKDAWVRGEKPMEEHVVKLLCNFWYAAKDVWPDAFDNPKAYRVQATAGIYSLHMALPAIIQRCLAERDLSREKMREILEGTAIQSSFWGKEDGDPLTLGTGMASIRALAQYMIDQLPATSPAQVKL